MENLVKEIQKNLTEDLLLPKFRGQEGKYAGYCYVATECFYYIYGRSHGWKPMCGPYKDTTHWWLEKDGEVLDITGEQFEDEYDYNKGKLRFFISHPSKRCITLVGRIQCKK